MLEQLLKLKIFKILRKLILFSKMLFMV